MSGSEICSSTVMLRRLRFIERRTITCSSSGQSAPASEPTTCAAPECQPRRRRKCVEGAEPEATRQGGPLMGFGRNLDHRLAVAQVGERELPR